MQTARPNLTPSYPTWGIFKPHFGIDLPIAKIDRFIKLYELEPQREKLLEVLRHAKRLHRDETSRRSIRELGIVRVRDIRQARADIERQQRKLEDPKFVNRVLAARGGQALSEFAEESIKSEIELLQLQLQYFDHLYRLAEAYKEAPGQRQAQTEIRVAATVLWSFWKDTQTQRSAHAINNWDGQVSVGLEFLMDSLELIGCRASQDQILRLRLD